MQHKRTVFSAAIISTCTAGLHADIVRMGSFESDRFEGFENPRMVSFRSGQPNAFDGMATLLQSDRRGQRVEIVERKQHLGPVEGERMLVSKKGGVAFSFSGPQYAFGGFYASHSRQPDAQIRFYSGDELVGSDTIFAPNDRTWAWNGWNIDQGFDRVEVNSNGGYLMHDAIRVLGTPVPTPGGMALLIGGAFTIVRRRR